MPDQRPAPSWRDRAVERARIWLGVITIVARAMRRCFFGVLAVVVILVFFIYPPQGKEILSLAVEGGQRTTFWWLALIVSATALALIVWYSSRVLMTFHDLVDTDLASSQFKDVRAAVEEWFPRVLGALSILPLVFFMADVGVKTHVLNSPLLIVAAFALLAAIDAYHHCLRCHLYRVGFLSSLLFVLASHRWSTEVPYGQPVGLGSILRWSFTVEGPHRGLPLNTTGYQLVIAIVAALLLDYACRRWSRTHAHGRLEDSERSRTIFLLCVVAGAGVVAWMITFWTVLLARTWYAVPLMLVIAVATIALFVHRRDRFPQMFTEPAIARDEGKHDLTAADSSDVHIASITKKVLWAAFIASAIVFLLVWFFPISTGQKLGTPALLTLALAIWVVFGGVVLTIVPKAYRLPALGLLPLLTAGCNALFDTPITISTARSATEAAPPARKAVAESFEDWMKSDDRPKDGPIYLVAAAGGGIRAAFLTASYLAAADDLSDGTFGKRVFVISGISGGSLGAATYALTGDGQARKHCDEGDRQPEPIGPRQRAILCTLGNDYLSPTVATFLFPDLFRAFWVPGFVHRGHWQDRGRTLEQAWTDSLGDDRLKKAFESRFLDYPASAADLSTAAKVHLILNATRVQSGHRVYASTFTWHALNAQDLFDPEFDTAQTSLVGAVHNSARFTYVSPAGAYFTRKQEFAGQVADGGYFDNSGVLPLIEVLDELGVQDADKAGLRERLRVIIITNDGSEKRICETHAPQGDASQVQVTAPIATFFASRSARAELSKKQMRRVLARLYGVAEEALCTGEGPKPPLVEVSLNNDVIAQFFREQGDQIYTGRCDDSKVPVADVKAAQSRTPQTNKEIAVWLREAPLGWTLSAATSDWLTRYARREACKLPRS